MTSSLYGNTKREFPLRIFYSPNIHYVLPLSWTILTILTDKLTQVKQDYGQLGLWSQIGLPTLRCICKNANNLDFKQYIFINIQQVKCIFLADFLGDKITHNVILIWKKKIFPKPVHWSYRVILFKHLKT